MGIESDIGPSSVDITELLPQKRPFVMVDRLLEYSERHSVTEFVVKEGNPLVIGGVFREGGVMENMAQSCAAHNGWMDFIMHRPVRNGVVGAVRNLEFHSPAAVGDRLVTDVFVLERVFDIVLMRVEVRTGGRLTADGELKLMLVQASSGPDGRMR